eukprot:TRINITY_DN736_c0_g1_i1.p1 TRINITY_DN736_c0_g1~~TRINITY_DN736_c0_g1_i1.p1  ORF type:complete len:186 (-),score=36.86 TRINITY_DN736_c0_g1_i1:183-740(-)
MRCIFPICVLLCVLIVALEGAFVPPPPVVAKSWEASGKATVESGLFDFYFRVHQDGDSLFAYEITAYMGADVQGNLNVWGSATASSGKNYVFENDGHCNVSSISYGWNGLFGVFENATYETTSVIDDRVCDVWLSKDSATWGCFEGNVPVAWKFTNSDGHPVLMVFKSFNPGPQPSDFFKIPTYC